jgi:anti-sigma regulatory factor (Ser/Thr protein kinase)
MGESIRLEYDVDGDNFESAGAASEAVKRTLKQLGIDSISIRRAAIAMYEGEINMVIHAHGGKAIVDIFQNYIEIKLKDSGPGIEDIDKAMEEGFSTATEKIRDLGFGAGMGLPNMKKHSDEMKIESELGKGTLVFLRINFDNNI